MGSIRPKTTTLWGRWPAMLHGPKAEAACWGWPSPRPNVARLAQAGAARLARVPGGHRAESRCGGVTPTSELVAEV
jgi:hypothetical protein